MNRIIEGKEIASAHDFHRALAELLGLPEHYGHNLDALWDTLSVDVERPVTLIWRDAAESRRKLGLHFDRIVEVLERVKRQDETWRLPERFDYRLE
jgi:ribonuclease inhibitor